MQATLRGFFHSANIYAGLLPGVSEKFHPLLRFPARRLFLQSQLGFPDSTLPKVDMARFERCIDTFDPSEFSIVFASAYVDNPASAMGHSFLRICSKKNTGQREILDYGVNYAANVAKEGGIIYSLKGVFGFFPGNYGLLPYYVSLQQYVHIENRDLWFYHLRLNDEQMNLILCHLWEMGNSYSRYYFFTKNCSYALIALLNVAQADSVDLLDSLPTVAIPIETIRSAQRAGIVDSITYRPATLTRINWSNRHISHDQQTLLRALVFAPDSLTMVNVLHSSKLSISEQAQVVDLALEYTLVKKRSDATHSDPIWSILNNALLDQRRSMPDHPIIMTPPIDTVQYSPLRVHEPYQAGIATGLTGFAPFLDLSFRMTYQDMNEFDEGLKPESVLDFLDLRLRMIGGSVDVGQGNTIPVPRKKILQVQEFTGLELASLSAEHEIKYPPSYWFALGIDRPPLWNTPNRDPLSAYGLWTLGRTVSLSNSHSLLAFGLAGGRVRVCEDYRYESSLQPMIQSGLKWAPSHYVSLFANAQSAYGILGQRGWELKQKVELRIGDARYDMRLAGQNWNKRGEASLIFHIYY